MKSIAQKVFSKYELGGYITTTPRREEYNYIKEWNPLLIAIYYGHMHVIKYYCEVARVHLRTTLSMSKGGDYALLFPLAVCLENPERENIFIYLWE